MGQPLVFWVVVWVFSSFFFPSSIYLDTPWPGPSFLPGTLASLPPPCLQNASRPPSPGIFLKHLLPLWVHLYSARLVKPRHPGAAVLTWPLRPRAWPAHGNLPTHSCHLCWKTQQGLFLICPTRSCAYPGEALTVMLRGLHVASSWLCP